MKNEVCILCAKSVPAEVPHLRFALNFTSTIGNGAVDLDRDLITVIHRECVVETDGKSQYDHIPYIQVARQIVGNSVPEKPEKPRHLTLLHGGLTG